MPHYIIHKDGAYNVFSTIVDAPWFVGALTEQQLRDWHREQFGNDGESFIEARLARAHATGCSGDGWTLDECIATNRAGRGEKRLDAETFVRRFLTLPT